MALLMVLFVAFYRLFNTGGAPIAEVRSPIEFWPFALLIAFLGVVVFGRRARRGFRLNQIGVNLLGQGKLVAALEKFELAGRQLGENAAIAHFNCGITRLRLW